MYGRDRTGIIKKRSQVIQAMIEKIQEAPEKSAEKVGQEKIKGLVPLVIVSRTAPYSNLEQEQISIDFIKVLLFGTALGADPIFGKVFKRSARFNSVLIVTFSRIIDIAAGAFVFSHNFLHRGLELTNQTFGNHSYFWSNVIIQLDLSIKNRAVPAAVAFCLLAGGKFIDYNIYGIKFRKKGKDIAI
jgi:hypothetical protein